MEIPIRIINGLYKGNSGIIIAFDGEKLVVEFLMLGRNIKANLRPEDTDIPEDDLRQIKAVFNETNKISASPFKPLSTAFGKKIAPAKEILNQHYPIKLPDDFYAFYEFWCELKTNNYYKDFIINISYGINLYGPFAVLDNPTPEIAKSCYEEHRFFNDPPEFFNVLTGNTDGLHWGYWVDDPKSSEYCIASYYHNDAWEIKIEGFTLFEAFRLELESNIYNYLENIEYNYFPEDMENLKKSVELFKEIRKLLMKYSTSERLEMGEEYMNKYGSYYISKYAKREITVQTIDGMGIVVSKEKWKDIQYFHSPNEIWDSLKDDEQKLKMLSNQALDLAENGYPGAALELGRNIWIYKNGWDLSLELLDIAYEKLERPELKNVLKYRKKAIEKWRKKHNNDEY